MIRRIASSSNSTSLGVQAVGIELLGDDVLLGDQDLLFLAVPGELDHLHPVEQGGGDRLQHVRGGDEHDLGEVEVDVEVVVAERGVLLRVEDLQERRGGISAEVGAELVDLVEHEHRVVGPDLRMPWITRPGMAAT